MARNNEATIWGIHAGRHGEGDDLFLKQGCVAVGWVKLGDLSRLAPTREAFKQAMAESAPHKNNQSWSVNAGQIFRYVHEMKVGDLIVYPSKRDRLIHIGRVTGEYRYDPKLSSNFPQIRTVQWLKELQRTQFSQGALYEIGSALTFFQVKNFADEFRAAIEGKAPPPIVPVEQDDSVAAVAEDIEETTRDFVLKRLAQELKGHPFAEFVAHLLNIMGYHTRVSSEGPDGGIDIVAHKDELGFEPPIIKVQVKSTEGQIGDPAVSSLYGKVDTSEFGLLVTLGGFTHQAKTFARSKSNLRLIDGEELVNLVFQHYDRFDSRYKGLLPLRRVYVPESLENEGD